LVEDRDTSKDTAAEIDGVLMKDMNEVDMRRQGKADNKIQNA